jgi:uncharacterized protein (TIGR03437 family)
LLENHNCSLDLASSSIEFNGNDLQIRAAMRFQPAFAGDTEVELWTFGQSLTYVKYRMGFWTVGPLPALTAQGVVNAASFSSGAIAPGEIVALLGSGLGPAAGLSAANTEALPTSLGETTVTFDGQPAPLFFAGDDRIYAQVPYEVAGKPSTSVVATYRDWAGAPVSIPVAAAAPGVFLILSPMTGAVVDASHPSGRGGKVSIYATGQGLVDPLPDTGKPAALSPLSWARNVQVKIGGRDVPIDFAGLTPGYVGLLQIDLHVPTDAPTGADVPLELSVDGAPAQAAPLTIAIQ